MKCAICRNGKTENGQATVVLERDKTTLVFKCVPAKICDNCGEEYISSGVNKTLLQHARAKMLRKSFNKRSKHEFTKAYDEAKSDKILEELKEKITMNESKEVLLQTINAFQHQI